MKRFKKFLKLAITILCVAFIVRFFYKNHEYLQIAFSLNFTMIISILGLALFFQLLQCYRFKIILEKCSGLKLVFWGWYKIFALGRFLNTAFPQLGNAYRGIELKKQFQISYTSYISGFASFAWMDTCMNLIIAMGIILALTPEMVIGDFLAWKILLVLTALALLAPLAAKFILDKIKFGFKSADWAKSKLSEVMTVTVSNLRDVRYMLKVIAIGLVVMFRTVLTYYILFRAFDIEPQITVLIIFYSLFKLSTFVNITPGNIGIQEIAYGFLADQLGIGMAQGILISVTIRMLGTSVIITTGLLFGGFELLKHREDITKASP